MFVPGNLGGSSASAPSTWLCITNRSSRPAPAAAVWPLRAKSVIVPSRPVVVCLHGRLNLNVRQHHLTSMQRHGFHGYPLRHLNHKPWRLQHAPRETVRGAIRGASARERLLFPSPAKSAQRRLRLRLVTAYVKRFGHDEFVSQYGQARVQPRGPNNWLPGGFAWWRERFTRKPQSEGASASGAA